MKKTIYFGLLCLLFSCTKDKDVKGDDVRLLQTESTSYNGDIYHTVYSYDSYGRITQIKGYKNTELPVEIVSVAYNGNAAILVSSPDFDPLYTQNTEVRLTLDADGKPLKRIEYTHKIMKPIYSNPQPETFRYDTLLYEYDAAGLLSKTSGKRSDSSWISPTMTSTTRFISTANYTVSGGNITAVDETVSYPVITRTAGVTSVSGGSSEYHSVYTYTKSFPNKTDFKNATVLNEYKLYYESLLNKNYKNLPDKILRSSVDRDINGAVIFSGNSLIEVDRTYDPNGFLSSSLLSNNTPYNKILYIYNK